jgi:hypothetical protein
LAIVFWYSLAKRYTTWTQLFLGLSMAVAPVGGWLAVGGAAGGSRGCSALAIGAWVGGFDVLYACQDLDFDRAQGCGPIPVRFGIRRVAAISRVDARRARLPVCSRWRCVCRWSRSIRRRRRCRAHLVYEQSLVAATICRR